MGRMIFHWEEKNSGYPKFLDWDEFHKEFQKDFCPAHSDVAAINKLESMTYYQKSQSVDDYLDEFVELVAEAGYTRPKNHGSEILKGAGSPDPEYHRYDGSPEDRYEAAKNIDQNRAAKKAFKLAY